MKRKRLLRKIKVLDDSQLTKLWWLVFRMELSEKFYYVTAAARFFFMASVVMLFLYSMLQPDNPLVCIVIIGAGLSIAIVIECLRILFEKKGASLIFSKSGK